MKDVLDPRPKLVLLLSGVVLFFLPLQVAVLGIVLAVLFLGGLFRVGRRIFVPLGSILPILLLVLILTPLFFRDGVVLFELKGFPIITSGGVEETLRLICRFGGITLCFALFYLTTGASEFLVALRWYGLPFKVALILNLTLRFIPSLFLLYNRVEDAHSLRRIGEKQKNSFAGRVSRLLPTLTSVLIQAIKGIAPLSMTLELRGVEARKSRSQYIRLRRGPFLVRQFFLVLLLLGIMVCVLVIFPGLWYKGTSV